MIEMKNILQNNQQESENLKIFGLGRRFKCSKV